MDHEHACAMRIKANYSNVNIILQESDPCVLYRASDIANALKMDSIRSIIRIYDCSEKCCHLTSTNGGNQMISYLTHKGLERILFASRSDEAIKLVELMGMQIVRKWFPCIELDVILNVVSAFRCESICRQFVCEKYRIDLYFMDYKIAVECDELQHAVKSTKIKDEMREAMLKRNLNCEFIRFNPFDTKFNVFELIGKIHFAITEQLKIKSQ